MEDSIPLRGLLGERASIVLFGDSLTQRGWEESGWCSFVANLMTRKADVYNRGFGGYNTRWAKYLLPFLFPVRKDDVTPKHLLVTVWFGANDAAAPTERVSVPLEEYTENLRHIVAYLRQCAHHVVVLTPPPVHGPTRLAFQRKVYGSKASGVNERSTAAAGRYGCLRLSVQEDWDVVVPNLLWAHTK
jgi:lysophospholipase L1-like esterase